MLFNNVRFQFPQEDLGTPSPSGPSKSSCSVPRDIRTGGDASPSRLTLVKAGNVFKTRLQPRSCHLEALLETESCVRQWQGDCASRASVDHLLISKEGLTRWIEVRGVQGLWGVTYVP